MAAHAGPGRNFHALAEQLRGGTVEPKAWLGLVRAARAGEHRAEGEHEIRALEAEREDGPPSVL